MWKKIGLIDINSNDKSSRSKGQNLYESFSQMSKLRSNQTQMIFQQNQSFCRNHLSKLKVSGSNQSISFKLKSLKDIQNCKSSKNLRQKFKIYGQKSENQQMLTNKTLQQMLLDKLNDSNEKSDSQIQEKKILNKQALNKQTLKKQKQKNQTLKKAENLNKSKNNIKKLQACRSSPNLLSNTIIEQISCEKKIATIKNIQALKRQHGLIKKVVNEQMRNFKETFDKFQNDLNNKIQENCRIKQQKQQQNQQNKDLHLKSILNRGIDFKNKMTFLNKQKADILAKYKALRSS